MGTVSQKLTYTAKAIDDIQKALEEKGFDMSGVELMRYGDFIRKITGQSGGGGSSEPTVPSFINKIESASFILYTTKKVNNVSTINVLYSKLPCTTKKVNGINGSSASGNLENIIKLERTLNRCFINYKRNNTTPDIKVLTRKPEQVNNDTILNVKVSFYNQKQIKQIEMEDTN